MADKELGMDVASNDETTESISISMADDVVEPPRLASNDVYEGLIQSWLTMAIARLKIWQKFSLRCSLPSLFFNLFTAHRGKTASDDVAYENRDPPCQTVTLSQADSDDVGCEIHRAPSTNLMEPRRPSRNFEQTDRDDDSNNFQLYQELYKYATEGKIDRFKETINVDDLDHANARVKLLSRQSPQNNTLLHIAVRFGHAKLVTEILQHRPLLLQKNYVDDTALHIAARAGDLDMVKTLLHEGRCTNNSSATKDIENNNDDDVIILMLRMKNDEENTALHEALIHGHKSVVECLIEADPAVAFYTNKEKKTPLYLAAEAGFAEILGLINTRAVEQNANIRVAGKSPLHAAILGRQIKVLEIISNMEKMTMESKDERGRTPLHCAASTGYLEGVRFLLLRRLSDSHRKDNGGTFPIHSASSNGHLDIVKELLRKCPDSKELLNSGSQNILHVAAKDGKDNLVSYFLKKPEFQMLMNQKDNSGNTPLHLAAMHHHPKVVYILTWNRKTDLKVLNDRSMTALDIVESSEETIASYHGRLTWKALKSIGAQRAQSLPQELVGKVGDSAATVPQSSVHFRLPNKKSITETVNALLVVATLVATVTFAAGFTMPGGYNSTLLTRYMFQVFVVCNTIAMYSAILVAVCLIWAQLGHLHLVHTVLIISMALPLMGVALGMMSLAFMAGVYLVVNNLHWLASVVLTVGIVFICIVLVAFTPLSFNMTYKFPILFYINYYLFCMEIRTSRSGNNDLKED